MSKEDKRRELQKFRNYTVVKANDMIQKSRFVLSMQEQKIILYLISKIKPEDINLEEHILDIAEFCKVCGLDSTSGGNYEYIKQTLKDLRDKSIWIALEDGSETLFAWIDAVNISKRSGRVKIRISNTLKPYLLQLKTHFTQYELIYTLAMKSQYSLRLYELLKSYEYQKEITFDIEELKVRLSAENYKLFGDFKRKVLDISMREMNDLSDLNVTYSLIKDSRRFAKITFSINRKKEIDENIKTWRNIYKIIDNS